MAEIVIREAQAQDTPTIADFVLAMARDSEGVTLDPQTVAAAVQAVVAERGRGVYYLAEVDGCLVGQTLVTTEWSDWNCREYWWLQSVYVRPDWRGKGVFDALYRQIVARACAAGAAAIRLYVHRDNGHARDAYTRVGMAESGYTIFEQPLGNPGGEVA
ncbi:MAG: N-acetyltransferase family protein [Armatimonadota bacterium]